jgi:hypothetical protein
VDISLNNDITTTMFDSILRSWTSFLLPVERQDVAVDAFYEILTSWTLFPTLILLVVCEMASYETVAALRKTKEGAALHTSGVVSTLGNLFFLGIPVHVLARLYVHFATL